MVDHFQISASPTPPGTRFAAACSTPSSATAAHKGDPLYRIRRRLLAGHEHLDPAGVARMLAWLDVGDPDGEVAACYLAKELLRAPTSPARLRRSPPPHRVHDHCNTSGVPELERLARTIGPGDPAILRWHRTGLTNAATEGTNLIVKNIKRLGFGFRNFDNYRLRLLLRSGAPWQHQPVASRRPRHPRISACRAVSVDPQIPAAGIAPRANSGPVHLRRS